MQAVWIRLHGLLPVTPGKDPAGGELKPLPQTSSGFEAPGFCDLNLEMVILLSPSKEGGLGKGLRATQGHGHAMPLVGQG